MRITISKENYLKTIAEAESEGETVKAVTLTRWLNVSAPAVTMAIRRLKRDGLILVAEEGQITLTKSGREIADPAAPPASSDRAVMPVEQPVGDPGRDFVRVICPSSATRIRPSRLSRLMAIVTAGAETFSQRVRVTAFTVSPSDSASAMVFR